MTEASAEKEPLNEVANSLEELQAENARLRYLLKEASRPLISQNLMVEEQFAPPEAEGMLVAGNVSYDPSYKSQLQEHEQECDHLSPKEVQVPLQQAQPTAQSQAGGQEERKGLSRQNTKDINRTPSREKREESQKRVRVSITYLKSGLYAFSLCSVVGACLDTEWLII